MLIFVLLSFAVILLFSYIIALISSKIQSKNNNARDFLFSNNTTELATTSNIGSILCISVVIGSIIPSVIGWGLFPILGIILGIILGYILLFNLGKRLTSIKPFQNNKTLIGLVNNESINIYRISLYLLYLTSIIIEIAIFKYLLNLIIPTSPISVFILLSIVLYLCASYISIGGYLGVLRTDLFQVLIFLSGVILILSETNPFLSENETKIVLSTFKFNFSNIVLFFTALIFAIAYNFAWPDLWIRNFSTLLPKKNKKLISIIIGCIGIIIVVSIIIIFSIKNISLISLQNKNLDIENISGILASIFLNIANSNSTIAWWSLGLVLCVFLTTIDTWIIGIMQHTSILNLKHIQILPFFIVTSALLTNYIFSINLIYLIALFNPLLLLPNLMILLLSIILKKKELDMNSDLKKYFFISGIVTIVLFFVFINNISKGFPIIVLCQFLLACIFLFYIPYNKNKSLLVVK